MLLDHIVEIFVGGDGDEGVKVVVRELIFQEEVVGPIEESSRDVGEERGERKGGVPWDADNAGFAAGVEQGFVVWPGEYVPVVAYHKPEFLPRVFRFFNTSAAADGAIRRCRRRRC